jgi:hypothetical protein
MEVEEEIQHLLIDEESRKKENTGQCLHLCLQQFKLFLSDIKNNHRLYLSPAI